MSNDNVIWLASYPKSGNTWIRTILQEMIAPGVSATAAIPSLIKKFPEDAPSYDVLGTHSKIVKTHCHTQHKRLRGKSANTVGVITIRRHPLDVLLSYLNFSYVKKKSGNFRNENVKTVEQIVRDGEIDYYIDEFIELDGCKEYNKVCRSWTDYYPAWKEMAANVPHLELCYEEMAENPVKGIEEIRSYLQLPQMDVRQLMSAVEQSTSLDGRFFWRKTAYNFRNLIPESSIDRFERRLANTLQRLGYELQADASVGRAASSAARTSGVRASAN